MDSAADAEPGPAIIVAGDRRTSGICAEFVLSNEAHASVKLLAITVPGSMLRTAATGPPKAGSLLFARWFFVHHEPCA
jgi:hypothetical protein